MEQQAEISFAYSLDGSNFSVYPISAAKSPAARAVLSESASASVSSLSTTLDATLGVAADSTPAPTIGIAPPTALDSTQSASARAEPVADLPGFTGTPRGCFCVSVIVRVYAPNNEQRNALLALLFFFCFRNLWERYIHIKNLRSDRCDHLMLLSSFCYPHFATCYVQLPPACLAFVLYRAAATLFTAPLRSTAISCMYHSVKPSDLSRL